MKKRLDKYLVEIGQAATRSQATNYIRLGRVKAKGEVVSKPGRMVGREDKVVVDNGRRYVSRAALKLESVADKLVLDFRGKTVLDVGSSTGGFSDFALQNGAKKVVAIDVGTDQMHPRLRGDERVELHEKTDIRNFVKTAGKLNLDIVLIDVSFISIRSVLVVLPKAISGETEIIAMVKPQFETETRSQKNKGVVKNENIRRQILSGFEQWAKNQYRIVGKADSRVAGEKGNLERFYKLALLPK